MVSGFLVGVAKVTSGRGGNIHGEQLGLGREDVSKNSPSKEPKFRRDVHLPEVFPWPLGGNWSISHGLE